ncbi:MAG: biotin/lipoyl-containing protein [bacterium]
MEPKDIRKFIDLIEGTDIIELLWEKDGVKIGLKKGSAPELSETAVESSSGTQKKSTKSSDGTGTQVPSIQEEHTEALSKGRISIKASIVGSFFRSTSADSSPFVEEGSIIKKGQKICVIEAMKVMKEITATVSGKIVKILVEDGSRVEYGQDMFLVDTKAKK